MVANAHQHAPLFLSVPNSKLFPWSKNWWRYKEGKLNLIQKDVDLRHYRRYSLETLRSTLSNSTEVNELIGYGFFLSDYIKGVSDIFHKESVFFKILHRVLLSFIYFEQDIFNLLGCRMSEGLFAVSRKK